MSKNYVLNDLEFDNVPLKIILPSDREECDKEELQKSKEKNREIIERMRNDKRYKDLVQTVINQSQMRIDGSIGHHHALGNANTRRGEIPNSPDSGTTQ